LNHFNLNEYKTQEGAPVSLVAITGSSGFLGGHLIGLLSGRDHIRVKALVSRSRGNQRWPGANTVTVPGDLLHPETLPELVEPGCTVVNLAYLASHSAEDNLKAMAHLVETCSRARIKRLIHCSTAVVVGGAADDEITEETPCTPANAYEAVKLELEHFLSKQAKGHFEYVILRPTAVFGPGGKNLLKLAGDLASGHRVVNYLRSCLYGYRRMNLVSVDNVTSAIAFLMEADRSVAGNTFIVSDDDAPTNNFRDVEAYLIHALGLRDYPIPRVALPPSLLAAALKLAGKSSTNPKRNYLPRKLMAAGYKRSVSFQEGLMAFADWYRKELQVDGTGRP
jgi:nucleoside-diphosphate-sugar epimerase